MKKRVDFPGASRLGRFYSSRRLDRSSDGGSRVPPCGPVEIYAGTYSPRVGYGMTADAGIRILIFNSRNNLPSFVFCRFVSISVQQNEREIVVKSTLLSSGLSFKPVDLLPFIHNCFFFASHNCRLLRWQTPRLERGIVRCACPAPQYRAPVSLGEPSFVSPFFLDGGFIFRRARCSTLNRGRCCCYCVSVLLLVSEMARSSEIVNESVRKEKKAGKEG